MMRMVDWYDERRAIWISTEYCEVYIAVFEEDSL